VPELSHVNDRGEARMVNVGLKADTLRKAIATGGVRMLPDTLSQIRRNQVKKGDVLAVARIAGIMAAKKTPELIPLCHTILLNEVSVEFEFVDEDYIRIIATAESSGKTGVEMEALVAASVSALTIYDMCKAVDRGMSVENVQLQEKSGGKSGTYNRGKPDVREINE
jgi:cyclic pyranopterin phosphate synthase